MFVTILTVIYLALAVFILIRFLKQSFNIYAWLENLKLKTNILHRESNIDGNINQGMKTSEINEDSLQPEYRRS